MSMSDVDGLASFIGKWRARWPEWAVAEVFVPVAERERSVAWFALRQELTDAAWAVSDPQPGDAKLAWWVEELEGWTHGRRRHPLALALQTQPVPWGALAASLPALRASRERSRDRAEASAMLEPFAEGVATVAATLHRCRTPAPAGSVVAGLLAERLFAQGGAAVPLQVLAKPGIGDATAAASQAWARELLDHWPQVHDGARPGRLHAAILRERLRALAQGRPPAVGPLRVLATAWRAARD